MLTLRSDAFEHEGAIPSKYTCDGENVSPPLSWENLPEGTKSFALIADDPDASRRVFNHWLIYNIPAETTALPEGVPTDMVLDNGARQGTNTGGRLGYSGPCPPSGNAHRYYFCLYALDTMLDLDAGAEKSDLQRAMEGHILAQAEIMGRYQRQ